MFNLNLIRNRNRIGHSSDCHFSFSLWITVNTRTCVESLAWSAYCGGRLNCIGKISYEYSKSEIDLYTLIFTNSAKMLKLACNF